MRNASAVLDARKAVELQRVLAERVSWEGKVDRLRNVVGLDLAYVGNLGIAVAALLKYPQRTLAEYVVVRGEVNIPYVPGLLAFREAPLMFKAYEKLGVDADLIVVDGHGVTHPRKFGIASHVGVVLDIPSIGAAKTRLSGRVLREEGIDYIEVDGRKGGVVLRRANKTIYLSIGHKVSVSEILRLVPELFREGQYLPEPTRVADRITKIERGRVARKR